MKMEIVVTLLSVCLGSSSLAAIILVLLQKKWTKDDSISRWYKET